MTKAKKVKETFELKKIIDDYLRATTWKIKDNANQFFSYSSVSWKVAGEAITEYTLNYVYPPKISEAHRSGDLHIHNLYMGICGYSFYRNETVLIREKQTKKLYCLSLEQLFDLIDAQKQFENGFEIKYTNKYEVLDENGWTDIVRVLRHKSQKPLISFNTLHGHNLIVTDDHDFITLAQEKQIILCPYCNSEKIKKIRSNRQCKEYNRDYFRCKNCNKTFNAPLETVENTTRIKKRASEIKLNNYALTPGFAKKVGLVNNYLDLNSRLAWILGLFIAEGYWRIDKKWKYLIFEFVKDTPEYKKLIRYLKKEKIYSTVKKGSKNYRIIVSEKKLPPLFRKMVESIRPYAENKNLPIEFMNLKPESVGAVISGIIDGDGVVREDDEWVSRINIRLTSKTLLSQIQFWVHWQGFNSTLSTIDSYGERNFQNRKITPQKQLYSLTFYIPKSKADLFQECLKITKNFKYSKKITEKFKEITPFRKIEKIKNDSEYVYDITTATHTFIANGVLVHNCAGWSIQNLLMKGVGIPWQVNCAPPKHFDSALNQIANFFGVVTNEWAGAQAVNSLDIFLAPFVRYDGLSYKDVKQKLQGFIYTLNLPTRWGGQCVSEDTEALTSNGWKKYYEINKDKDKIATFNLKTKKIEYLKPERVMAYDYDGYLICLKNRTQEQLVTPNHKVVRKKFNSDEFELIEAEKLLQFKTPVLVPIAAEVSNRKKINPWLVRLLAWLVSEGTFSEDRERVSLYQSEKNKENCKEIRECLNKLKFSWDETKRIHGWGKTPLVRFRLNQESSRKIRQLINSKKIPNFIKELIPEQIKLFIDTYIKGDGYIGKFKKRISTKDIMVRNQLQELCPLAGYGTTNRLRKHNNVWEINVLKNKLAIITKIFYVRYKGKVWCPTTENGTFVARRNGKVFITGNTPFTNITFDLKVPDDLASKPVIIGGKFQKEKYKDFQKEVDMINRAFAEIMLEGNSQGRVFTFPIPTYNVTRDFDWNSPIVDLIFEMTAKYGIPYFQNFVRSKLDPHEIRAMCCHLRLDLTQLKYRRVGGFFGFADQTGSVGVVTINMPRIGYLAKNEKDFFKRLGKLMDIARDSLEIKRKVVAENMKRGLLPFSQKYLGTLRAHFSTIGLVGMHEACLNFLGKGIETDEGKQFAIKVLNFMRDKLVEYQKQTGNIYNLEATPAESTAHRFARIDKEKWPKIKTAGVKVPYYTNSTHLPVGYTDDVFKALKHQNDLQVLYTGGTIFHAYLDERPTAKACKAFVKKIFENFDLPYITITPTFSICPDHGYIPGEHFKCPKCGKVAEVYSRVVGFLRPVQNWNVGKQEEFRERLEYKIEA